MLSIILYQNSTVNVFLYGIADPKATTEICLAPVTIYKLMNIHPEMRLELSTRGRACRYSRRMRTLCNTVSRSNFPPGKSSAETNLSGESLVSLRYD